MDSSDGQPLLSHLKKMRQEVHKLTRGQVVRLKRDCEMLIDWLKQLGREEEAGTIKQELEQLVDDYTHFKDEEIKLNEEWYGEHKKEICDAIIAMQQVEAEFKDMREKVVNGIYINAFQAKYEWLLFGSEYWLGK